MGLIWPYGLNELEDRHMRPYSSKSGEGFTLIELLIVIGIIGFLASAILVAVDPVRRIQDSRNARRWSEVNAILNAILNKQVDDRAQFNGSAPVPIIDGSNAQILVNTDSGLLDCTVAPPTCDSLTLNTTGTRTCYANISGVTPDYIADLPLDPNGGTGTNSGYYIRRSVPGSTNSTGRIEIGSCNSELNATIKVKR